MATPGTLDQYSFRQQRRRTPDSKEPVIKPESKPHTAQQQQHQDQSTSADDIAILKAFDLEYTYGPAVGITRLERWERARDFGLNPPQRVKDLIDQHPQDPTYTECLWNDTLLSENYTCEEQ